MTSRAYAYPRWHGLERLTQAFGRKVPLKYRDCCICGNPASRLATIQITWFRSDDQLFALCGPDNFCRDRLKEREGVQERFSSQTSGDTRE